LIVCEYSKTETITSLERVSRDITLNEANVINKTKINWYNKRKKKKLIKYIKHILSWLVKKVLVN
jgi:hypothetical protein